MNALKIPHLYKHGVWTLKTRTFKLHTDVINKFTIIILLL